MRSRALMRPWWPHFGHTLRFFSRSVRYSTASHAGHLTQSPSGIDFLLTPGVALIRGGRSFCNQLIGFPEVGARSGRSLGDLVDRDAYGSEPRCGAPCRFARRAGFNFLNDATADHDRVGMRGDRPRAGRVADAEADADRQGDVLADLGEPGDDLSRVEMPCAGDALERDVIDIA